MRTLRQMREDRGLSQEELAAIVEVSPFTIIRWEQGKVKPSATNVLKLARVLKVSGGTILRTVLRSSPQAQPESDVEAQEAVG